MEEDGGGRDDRIVVDIPYYPHDGQKPFHYSPAKFRAILSGIGFGKSAAGVNEFLLDVMTHPGTLNLIFAPTFPMLKNTTMREFRKFCPQNLIYEHNRSDRLITFVNGAQAIYLSGDNERDIDRIRGLTLGCAYGDELSLVAYYVFEILVGRLRDPNGSRRMWITATPKGRNWVHRLFRKKEEPRTGEPLPNPGDYELFGGSTFDNPYTPQDYKETLKHTYTGAFAKQELYGEFVGFEGLVYADFNHRSNVISEPPEGLRDFIAGVDFGYTNPSAIVVIGFDEDGRAYLVDEFYQNRVQIEDILEAAHSLREKYGIQTFYADPARPEYIDRFNREGLYCEGQRCEVMARIHYVAGYIPVQDDGRPRLYVVEKKCPNVLNEFGLYRMPEKKDDKPVKDMPIKQFDHAMDALGYALWSKRDVGGVVSIGSMDDVF